MVFRSFIKDFLVFYLCYKIIKGFLTHNFSLTSNFMIVTILLLLMTVWFLLEKIGILPKLG